MSRIIGALRGPGGGQLAFSRKGVARGAFVATARRYQSGEATATVAGGNSLGKKRRWRSFFRYTVGTITLAGVGGVAFFIWGLSMLLCVLLTSSGVSIETSLADSTPAR